MRRILTILAMMMILGVAITASNRAGERTGGDEAAAVRVGTFDSRAIALAHYRSEAYRHRIEELEVEHAAAVAAGQDERAAELEAVGRESQALAHKQGFGTWPVDDILAGIADRIPAIAEAAGVDVIVSTWDVVHAGPGVEFIDVTAAMVQPFAPDAATMTLILEELPKVDPVPIAELENHEH